VLLRLEARDYQFPDPSNVTSDFFGDLLNSEKNLPKEIPENVVKLNDDQLNERLTAGVQKFFKDRPIKLHFIPNTLVKLVPSNTNDLEVSLKKIAIESFSSRQLKTDDLDADDSSEISDKNAKDDTKASTDEMEKGSGIKKKGYYLQLGLPLVLAPYMVFAGFLPMLIPVLKLATAFTTIVNMTALIASIMYLARQHAIEKEMQQTVYFNPGYKDHH
jgi:hypothetical protein